MAPNNITTEPVLIEPISIDLDKIIEHGESPTAIILAITILTAVLLDSLTKLLKVIGTILESTNSPNKDDSKM
jgi:hypothetical protein